MSKLLHDMHNNKHVCHKTLSHGLDISSQLRALSPVPALRALSPFELWATLTLNKIISEQLRFRYRQILNIKNLINGTNHAHNNNFQHQLTAFTIISQNPTPVFPEKENLRDVLRGGCPHPHHSDTRVLTNPPTPNLQDPLLVFMQDSIHYDCLLSSATGPTFKY